MVWEKVNSVKVCFRKYNSEEILKLLLRALKIESHLRKTQNLIIARIEGNPKPAPQLIFIMKTCHLREAKTSTIDRIQEKPELLC
jgi:hypothetical protein